MPRTYEHIDPALVGNRRVFVVSEMAGGASVVLKAAEELGIPLDKRSDAVRAALEEMQEREGYSFDLAPASAMLILM